MASEYPSGRHRNGGFKLGRQTVIGIPYLWSLLFFLLPFSMVVLISFSETILAVPPYRWLVEWEDAYLTISLNLQNYFLLWEDSTYLRAYLGSLKIAAISTLLALAIGFPLAYAMSRAPKHWRASLLMLIILPFWTSFLIRVYAWIGILKQEGLLNLLLLNLGIIDEPLLIHGSEIAVYIGIVYSYLPFMVLPLYATLEKLDMSLLEAAYDLGCRPIKAFWLVVVPQAVPGIIAGCALVFIPAVGEFVVPDLLGGSDTLMIGKVLWSEFFTNLDWPLASAVAVILLILLVGPVVWFQRHQAKQLS
ncbi:ABC transporter permease subunit [Balneatrix alpica]|uniref:ABC transporter permease subunit n=1 Tax=Balneatrix alpica TaxID=75684 RepID=A0ABV5ZF51_9GAMM|nr:ABC transporter permease subunit [Balneatrix alpica]